jgi:D-lactate dehydrogenase (cytochrome)
MSGLLMVTQIEVKLILVAVPISKLPDLIEKSKEAFEKSGLHTTIVSHALDGNFRILTL